jgi:hypothetical protein
MPRLYRVAARHLEILWHFPHLPDHPRAFASAGFLEDSKMTHLSSCQDRSRNPSGKGLFPITLSWLRAAACRTANRTIAALKTAHRAIKSAKARRLQRELMFHAYSESDWSFQANAPECRDASRNGANYPQQPLILSDKWDF